MPVILHKALLLFLYLVLAVILMSTIVGLPGNWLLIAAVIIIGLVTGFSQMTWGMILLCLGLALLGEVIESLLGAGVVAKKGGSRWGVIGSILGGLAGVLLGGTVFPPIGSVVLGFLGAFGGAVLGELVQQPRMDAALRIGFWSFVGRLAAIAGKLSLGFVIFWIILRTTWP